MEAFAMLADFPKLGDGQHAVLAAEVQTGIVLDLDGRRWLSNKPTQTWRIFDSLESARRFAVVEIATNPAVEFSIFDSKGHFVERIPQ